MARENFDAWKRFTTRALAEKTAEILERITGDYVRVVRKTNSHYVILRNVSDGREVEA